MSTGTATSGNMRRNPNEKFAFYVPFFEKKLAEKCMESDFVFSIRKTTTEL